MGRHVRGFFHDSANQMNRPGLAKVHCKKGEKIPYLIPCQSECRTKLVGGV
jgi:hypothetical protein